MKMPNTGNTTTFSYPSRNFLSLETGSQRIYFCPQ